MDFKKLKFWDKHDTPTSSKISEKFCRNCKFFVAKTGYCDNPKTLHISLVTGKPIREVNCSNLRLNSNMCGYSANWFEANDKVT